MPVSHPVIITTAMLLGPASLALAAEPGVECLIGARKSLSFPLAPSYRIHRSGAVSLCLCFNWSCSTRQILTFSPEDMAGLKRQMQTCSGDSLHNRLQTVRIGIWQMEVLAQKYQPLLANDRAINDFEAGIPGRMDCIDNTSNTTTYLNILKDLGALSGWRIEAPRIRNRFDITGIHWTAVIADTATGDLWSLDSWYRPNGHLPMVMPLESWMRGEKAWEPPYARLNATPHAIDDLCTQGTP